VEDATATRIFIKGFDPIKTSEDDLRELFSGIGIIARVRQKQGFPDQWPFAVKIYKDERGQNKDECVITYDDPMAAQSAPGFYNGYDLKGSLLTVTIATTKKKEEYGDGGGGGYGDGGGALHVESS
jgi:RNA-binding protein FUS